MYTLTSFRSDQNFIYIDFSAATLLFTWLRLLLHVLQKEYHVLLTECSGELHCFFYLSLAFSLATPTSGEFIVLSMVVCICVHVRKDSIFLYHNCIVHQYWFPHAKIHNDYACRNNQNAMICLYR